MGKLDPETLARVVERLPALPHTLWRVMKLTSDPEATAADLARAVGADQALTAGILRLANSAFYGLSRKVATVKEAVVVVGFEMVRSMAMATSVSPFFKGKMEGYWLQRGELWKHSLACGATARLLARRSRMVPPEEGFVAGLLHDMGKVVLDVYVRQHYQAILEKVEAGGGSFVAAERETLGYDHAQVGARLAERWNLPPALVEAIAHHHQPMAAPEHRGLACLTHLADLLAMMLGVGLGWDGLRYPGDAGVLEALRLRAHDVDEVLAEVSASLQSLQEIYS